MSPLGHIVERCGESCYYYYTYKQGKSNRLRKTYTSTAARNAHAVQIDFNNVTCYVYSEELRRHAKHLNYRGRKRML